MASRAKKETYIIEIEAPVNGRLRAATVIVRDGEGKTRASDQANLSQAKERKRVGKELARQLGEEAQAEKWQKAVDNKWTEVLEQQRQFRKQMAAGSAEAVAVEATTLLDTTPPTI